MRWILPRPPSEIRAGFDAFCSSHQFEPDIQAEVDDMAMLRLLARDSGALAILPRVVVRDEIRRLELSEYMALPTVTENFYAITVQRSYQPPALRELLKQRQSIL
ncbi:MAG: LysR substrate-binding domain-containing protein [Alcanivoracaceae bacterium]|nr:LysR substrate-binding domain-containing protein [Alcanivoracaceae bacterium]